MAHLGLSTLDAGRSLVCLERRHWALLRRLSAELRGSYPLHVRRRQHSYRQQFMDGFLELQARPFLRAISLY